MNREQQQAFAIYQNLKQQIEQQAEDRKQSIAQWVNSSLEAQEPYYKKYETYFNQWVQRDYWTALEYTLLLTGIAPDLTTDSSLLTPRQRDIFNTILRSPKSLGAKEPLPKVFTNKTLLSVSMCLSWPAENGVYQHPFWERAVSKYKSNITENPSQPSGTEPSSQLLMEQGAQENPASKKLPRQKALVKYLGELKWAAEQERVFIDFQHIPVTKDDFANSFALAYPSISHIKGENLRKEMRSMGLPEGFRHGTKKNKDNIIRQLTKKYNLGELS